MRIMIKLALVVIPIFIIIIWNLITSFGPESPVSVDTPAPSSTLSPASTVMPSPSPVPRALLKHLSEKRFMLELINAERAKARLDPLILGDNIAAQLHAESALENCFGGHWGIDGLKPYMRYSLVGGYQPNGENVSGPGFCATASDGYQAIDDIKQEIREAMEGLMNSADHRCNILSDRHKQVNIGLAWDRYNFHAVQHFEGDYVEYEESPSIQRGFLNMSGRTKNSAAFAQNRDLGILIPFQLDEAA